MTSGNSESVMKTTNALLGIIFFIITLSQVVPVRAQSFLTNGLVVYYPFNGNAKDASGNGNDGTVEGAILTADRFGHANSAYYFNGTNSDILVPETLFGATNQAWTISVWITLDSGPYVTLTDIYAKSSVNGEMDLITATNSVQVVIKTASGAYYYASAALVTNSTIHMVGVYQKGQSLSLYINGVLSDSVALPNEDLWLAAYPLISALGAYHLPPTPFDCFRGTLSDFRVYTRALSGSEVQQLYQYESAAGCVPPPPGLVSWWRLEGNGDDQTLLNPGVVVGNPGFVPGEVGLALNSSGPRTGVVVSNSASLNFGPGADFSIEAWIRPAVASTTSGIMDLVDKRLTNPDLIHALGYVLSLAAGKLEFQMSDSLSSPPLNVGPTGPDLRDDAWHHVAATIRRGATDGGTLYIDGVPTLTFDPTGYAGSLGTSAPLLIGLFPTYSTIDCDYRGGIDEVSVYARALSSAEVQAIYGAGTAGKCKPSSCVPPPPGLVSWWPGEGNANDIVGTNNGTLVNGAAFAPGIVGQAFSFDGTNAYIRIADNPSLHFTNAMTVEAWVYPTSLGANQAVVSKWDLTIPGAQKGYTTWVQPDGLIGFGVCDDGYCWQGAGQASAIVVSTNPLPVNQWTHFAATYDGSALRIYINGVYENQTAYTNGMFPGTGDLRFGCAVPNGGAGVLYPFAGRIDEPSLYNRALSSAEIQAIYLAGSAGKCQVPFITSQPQGQTAIVGSTMTFMVTAAGAPPLSYQWQFNSTNIAGATASSLTLTNVQPGQAGSYLVVVSNALGVVTSSNAVLKVISPTCATPPAGLVAWWPGEGTANDIAGTNNGTLIGGASFVSGEVGQAFSFNGANQCVQIPYAPSLASSNYSVEAWVKPLAQVSDPINQVVIFGQSYGQYQLAARTGSTGIRIAFQFGASPVTFYGVVSTNEIPLGQFTHLAGTWDGSTLRLYINGVLNAQTTPGASPVDSGCPFSIGGFYESCGYVGQFFNGLIDEVSYYNRALSGGEVQAIYLADGAGKCRLPRVATASAVVVNGFVVGANITDGGYGYTSTPIVKIIGGGGSGAQAVAVVSNGVVIAVNVVDAGSGYTNTPVIVFAPPFTAQPTMTIGAASLLSFTSLAVGTNYQLQFFSSNTWSNLGQAFTAASPTFTQYVTGTAGPNGYRLASTSVSAQAYATAQVINGFVVGATVTSGGSGYGSNVVVSIVGGGGSNATAIATVSGGVVTGLTITDAGIGYTTTPSILIAPPPANALWPMVTQAVELDLGSLSPYDNYQLEFAPVLGGAWSNVGSLFTPTATTSTQYINASGNAGFFRVSYVP